MSHRRFTFCLTFLTIAVATAQDTPPPKKELPKADAKTAPSAKATKKAPAVDVPDLAALVAKPVSELRPLVRMYQADQGALRRKYSMPTVGGDYSRLSKFYLDWAWAVDQVELASLSNAGVDELAELRKRIQKDGEGHIAAAAKAAEI